MEILEIAQRNNRKVNVVEKNMNNFLHKVLDKNSLLSVISNNVNRKANINLLTVKIDEMEQKISNYIDKGNDCLFVSCLFPMSGGEEKLARVIDLLHSQDNQVLDLGRSENLSVGTNFYDLKFLLKNLNPNGIISLQNSYKHGKYLSNLKPFKFIMVPN